jgi:hypothetical protein
MLGRDSDAHAQDAAVVGRTTFHQMTEYVWTTPELFAYMTFIPTRRRPL